MAVVKRVYLCTQAEQTFTVPTGVSSVTFEAWGATGGADYRPFGPSTAYPTAWSASQANAYISDSLHWNGGPDGGSSPVGYVKGTLAVTVGQVYYLYVGGNGQNGFGSAALGHVLTGPLGGYNGGGNGGGYNKNSLFDGFIYAGGGGGGATDVRFGGNALANRVLVAGGGGGAGGGWATRNNLSWNPPGALFPVLYAPNGTSSPYSSPGTQFFVGGAGSAGCGGGGNGTQGTKDTLASLAPGLAATGGSLTAGGAAGTNTDTQGANGASAGFGFGGQGASPITFTPESVYGGGGGGSGYYGGGGGATGQISSTNTFGCGGGGGGGSNFVGGSFTNTVNAGHLWPADSIAAATATPYPWLSVVPTVYPGGYLRLTYSQPPNAPTIVTPLPNQRVAVGQPLTVSWIWSSPASADGPQADGGADVVYNTAGDVLTYVPAQLVTPAEGKTASFTFPAGTFTAGLTYTLKVRIYDSNGDVSAYSPTITLRAINAPTAPVITPALVGSDLDFTSYVISWTNPNGAGTELLYRVVTTGNETGTVLDTGMLHSNSRLNICLDATMKASLGSWTTAVGSSATDAKTDPWSVANCYKTTWSATTGARRFSTPITTIPGVTYTFSGYFAAAAATDPGMAIGALDPTTLAVIAQSPTTAVAGTPGNWQRVSVTFTATAASTLLAFLPQGGTTLVSYFSSSMAEIGAQLGLYFATATSKDPGVSGTFSTPSDGFLVTAASDVLLTSSLTGWPGAAEPVTITVYLSTTTSIDTFSSASIQANLNRFPPGTPTGSVVANPGQGCNTLSITLFNGSVPVVSADIYRSVVGVAGSEVRIARIQRGVSTSFVYNDYAVVSDIQYQYRVKAISLTGGFKNLT